VEQNVATAQVRCQGCQVGTLDAFTASHDFSCRNGIDSQLSDATLNTVEGLTRPSSAARKQAAEKAKK